LNISLILFFLNIFLSPLCYSSQFNLPSELGYEFTSVISGGLEYGKSCNCKDEEEILQIAEEAYVMQQFMRALDDNYQENQPNKSGN